jgi:hypothetical protein
MFLLPFAGKGTVLEITGSDLCNGIVCPASTLTITGESNIGPLFYGIKPHGGAYGGIVQYRELSWRDFRPGVRMDDSRI